MAVELVVRKPEMAQAEAPVLAMQLLTEAPEAEELAEDRAPMDGLTVVMAETEVAVQASLVATAAGAAVAELQTTSLSLPL